MINTLKQTICDYSSSLAYLANNVLPFSDGNTNTNKLFARGRCADRVRAKILPQSSGISGLFAPDTLSWLRQLSKLESGDSNNGYNRSNQVVFTLTILGVTNRPLPGYKKAGFNLFKTIVKVIAADNIKNLDQCIIEFSPRFPVSMKDFESELSHQICIGGGRFSKKGRLTFFAHGLNNAALASDLEALRLCVIKTMPVINIDWLNIDSSWDVMWNPCASLKPEQKKLEAKLTRVLDGIIEQACASNCNIIVDDSKSFFDTTYLSYRGRHELPKLNTVVAALPISEPKTISKILKSAVAPAISPTDGWLPVLTR